jgi:dihydrofolate synthase/folylpolyglutamate synthase
VEWAVAEVGMGGRLDATNVVRPEVAVVTRIGMDHTKTLGDAIALIAAEKAGLVKPGVPVVSSALHPDARSVVERAAAERGCPLYLLGRDFRFVHRALGWDGSQVEATTWRKSRRFRLPMLGERQSENAAVAFAAYDVLVERCRIPEPDAEALAEIDIPCRIELVCRSPAVILDAAHNESSAEALAETLDSLPKVAGPRVLIFGATQDKDWQAMLRILTPKFSHIVFTQYRHNPRAVPAARLVGFVPTPEMETFMEYDPKAAWSKAWSLVSPPASEAAKSPSGLICATGSFFLASELRPLMTQTLACGRNVYNS